MESTDCRLAFCVFAIAICLQAIPVTCWFGDKSAGPISSSRYGNTDDFIGAVLEYGPKRPDQLMAANGTRARARDVINANLREFKKFIKLAAEQDVDLLVFPEYGLTSTSLPSWDRVSMKEYLQVVPKTTSQPPCLWWQNKNIRNYDKLAHSKPGEAIIELSCLARQHEMYLVVNLGEIEHCVNNGRDNTRTIPERDHAYILKRHQSNDIEYHAGCPNDGAYHYNTNVVFDKQGNVVARYRKTNLYLEPFDKPSEEEAEVIFEVGCGMKFGVITCFDILHETPAMKLIRDRNITHMVYPTAWVDEIPFLTAIQAQESFARGHSVTLLAAGHHRPSTGSRGSGIYGRDGPKIYTFGAAEDDNKILIAKIGQEKVADDIPTCEIIGTAGSSTPAPQMLMLSQPTGESQTAIPDPPMLQEDLSNYTTANIEPGIDRTLELCSGDLERFSTVSHSQRICCQLRYSLVQEKRNQAPDYIGAHTGNHDGRNFIGKPVFKFLAFSGDRLFGGGRYQLGTQLCGVVQCQNNALTSCSKKLDSRLLTSSIEFKITGNFSFPTSLPHALSNEHKLVPADSWILERIIEEVRNNDNPSSQDPAIDGNPQATKGGNRDKQQLLVYRNSMETKHPLRNLVSSAIFARSAP